MKTILVLLTVFAVSCAPKHDITIATVRSCDFSANTSKYNLLIINSTDDSVQVKYKVSLATKQGKHITPQKAVYFSPVIQLSPREHRIMLPMKLDTLYNQYILFTELESTTGDWVTDKVYPCGTID